MRHHAIRLRKGELEAMTPEARKAHLKAQADRYYNLRYERRLPKCDREGHKICRGCNQTKPATAEHFGKSKTAYDGLASRCRPCLRVYGRTSRLKDAYQLTRDEYNALMRGASCAICGASEKLVLDHCHDKLHIRGVLCNHCNSMLGFARDDPNNLRSAIDYLARTRDGFTA